MLAGKLIVRVPLGASRAEVEDFVHTIESGLSIAYRRSLPASRKGLWLNMAVEFSIEPENWRSFLGR